MESISGSLASSLILQLKFEASFDSTGKQNRQHQHWQYPGSRNMAATAQAHYTLCDDHVGLPRWRSRKDSSPCEPFTCASDICAAVKAWYQHKSNEIRISSTYGRLPDAQDCTLTSQGGCSRVGVLNGVGWSSPCFAIPYHCQSLSRPLSQQ